ncbi:PREDICTED: vacuolar protein sorting-associated protein 13B isoform X2 [Drosophila arizonae]|uniref:Vacuolar protein sorting-associated protein 13B isoform X2 n=1 Tax=Drosophila arizonae TaxID=7263 RepID=A0ABM1NWI5_DROAR|nr:PREDICTED: vacuolar protein sorting-associated protein 13B isoform X2 [Drosophila arizonae]
MFKLESYITPILLNYVAKYVKNIRDEDAQVSLWEGEASFHNLDLRLDVLEEELNLPIELVSGHIHELSIQVPWTKLTSEPVRIEINTIEFVAKLPNEESKQRRASLLEEQRRKRNSVEGEEPQQQAGTPTPSGVVNKIINNINLQCHNIILKYVDDDIVVSMNVQYLNFSAADEHWQPAMVDVHPVNVYLRKLLQISDLTICLDKRNTAGRIEVCQEPILYRCTLELRVLLKHNANTVSTSSTKRIGVFTKSLDINVSSLQLPMVMKLVKLLLELKPSEPAEEENIFNLEQPVASTSGASAGAAPTSEATGSMFWRAWNLLPSFEGNNANSEELIGHALDIGVYAEEFNFQLKNSELINDQAMGGLKRIRYTPIVRLSLGGIYYERSQLKENDWTNVRAGLSSICMEPLGIYRSDDPIDRNLVSTKEHKNARAFVDKSLFDDQYKFADRVWCGHNHDDYFARHTDEYMLFRSPVLAFDVVECRAPKPAKNQKTPETPLRDLGLRMKYRVLSAGIAFHFSQSFVQVKNVISDLLRPYDYTGYTAESPIREISNSSPVRSEPQETGNSQYMTYADLEYLIGFMPTCDYRIELRDMTVKLFPRQQSAESSTTSNQHRLSTTINQSLLPYLQLNLSLAEGSITTPANPKRLVQLITQLQEKPRELIDSCYNNFKFNVKNVTLMAQNTTAAMGHAKLMNIPSMQLQFKNLLLPNDERFNSAPTQQADVQTELINVEFSKRELVIVNTIVPLIFDYNGAQLGGLAKMVAEANVSADVIKLQTLITKVQLNYLKFQTHLAMLFSLRNLNTDVYHTMMNIRNVIISTNKGSNNKWLELQLQLPQEASSSYSKVSPATAICIWVDSFRLTLDIYLLQFLNSFANPEQGIENDPEADFDSFSQSERFPSYASMTSVPKLTQSEVNLRRTSRSNSRKISNPAETIHASSERDEKPVTYIEPVKLMPKMESTSSMDSVGVVQLISRLNKMAVVFELSKARIDVCDVMLRRNSKDLQVEYTAIQLSRLRIKSSNGDEVVRGNIRTVINVNDEVDLCNLVMEANDFSVAYHLPPDKVDMIVEPVRTTIALALSHKLSNPAKLRHIDSEPNKADEPVDQQWPITYSVNVHMDMSPINVFARHLKLLSEHFTIVNAVGNSLSTFTARPSPPNEAERRCNLEIYTGSAQNYSILKEFLELKANVEPMVKTPDLKTKGILTFFCQWTIPRISLEVESCSGRTQRKLLLSLEDLLLNVDRHEDFTKITTKLENVSLNYYEAIDPDDWRLMDDFHIKVLGDSTNLPLISIVVTTVNLQDLYSKIGARNVHSKRRTISELLIEVQPIEMILHVDKITEFLLSQCELIDMLCNAQPAEVAVPPKQARNDCLRTVHDLPIVHLNSKGIYIYVPVETDKRCCSVLLLRIENINLTPTVENPLVRQPIRQDIYNKAAELNMLSTPGGLVEDRQYELSVRKISLSSGNWLQTQKFRLEKLLSNKHTNPALEWNKQSQSTELEQMDIFKDFDFIIVYAPAISYERFLVCGESVEFNCVTDFVATLNTHQIHMISAILNRVQRWRSIVEQPCLNVCPAAKDSTDISGSVRDGTGLQAPQHSSSQWLQTQLRDKLVDAKSSSATVLGSCQSDSGINVAKYGVAARGPQQLHQMESQKLSSHKLIYPRSVSFVAGKFELRVYDVLEEQEKLTLRPLLLVTVSQPSFMAAQTPRGGITQASVFNFNIHLAKQNTECKATVNETFCVPVFDTQPGTLDSSGIPPPLLTVRTQLDRFEQLELDVELRKPMELSLCESSIKVLSSDLIRIYSMLSATPYFPQRSERPVVHTTPLRQLKLQCFNADRLHLACDRITVKFYDDEQSYNCSAVWLDFNAHIKFSARPQKASVKSTLGCVYVQAGDKILLHPLLMRLSADLLSETWCDQLLSSVTLKLNVLHVDASIENILHLRQAQAGLDSIRQYISEQWQQFLLNRPMLGEPRKVAPNELLKYTPSVDQIVRSKTTPKTKMEFYQDDLRAGAFQFVDLTTDTVLPMPYQVQIIKKNYGIICWRYPQPRQMSRLHIYPVPMPIDNPIHIKCRMEYFSETHETFLHYCDFELSEIDTKQLVPPDRNITATIWRVVIMQSLISVDGTCFVPEEDDDLQSIDSSHVLQDHKGNADSDFILHPKVLVGCMRIDTIFQAELVPKLQLLLSCQYVELNMLNQPDASSVLPAPLQKYFLRRTTNITQTFLSINVDDLQLHSAIYTRNNYSAELNFRGRIKCLDYGSLNMMDIMEPMSFQSYLRFNATKRLLQANLLLDKLRFNCGPCVIHTLLCSKQHWTELLQQQQQQRDSVHTLMPRCVIVNRMQTHFVFGQTGTNERITVVPQELRPYYFCNDAQSQELTFYIEDLDTHSLDTSESLAIALKFEDEHRVHHLRVGQYCITVKLSKLSATQVYILVKGQIELVSMVPFELLTEFRTEGKQLDEQAASALAHLLAPKGRISFYQQVQRNEQVNMRLKLSSLNAKGRTGDIPLKPNNSLPWLVKVPTQTSQQFVSLWVRILREDIELASGVEADDFKPQRILVSIWPIFEICNLLSCELQATESSSQEKLTIAGEGGRLPLNTATTHSTEHCVKFDFPSALGSDSKSEYTFMLKSMDWHKFFHYNPADWTIERTLDRLDKSARAKWPLNDAEELRVQRPYELLSMLDVQYRAQATREFSCTLGLEVAPWAMFINDTNLDVSICLVSAGVRHKVRASCLEMLPVLSGHFTIDAPFGSNWVSSMAICVEQHGQASSERPSGSGRHVLLRANSYVDIVLVRNDEVLRLLLEFRLDDARRVFKLRSKYVIANCTDIMLTALPLTMDHKESSGREEISSLKFDSISQRLKPVQEMPHSNIGATIEKFHDLNAHKSKHTCDTAFVYFVCFSVNGGEKTSIPIPLTMPFTRRCFNIQDGSDSIPLMSTLIEKDNVYYLNVFRDSSPAIIINNNTNVRFIVAQTSASGNSNVTCTSPEFTGKHFEWNQLIEPYSRCYYTPPQMYANFPDVEFTMCNLSLALYTDMVACGKQKISWSKPIRTDKSWKKFIHVPNHGDIKVVICDKHRAIRFNIYYIAQQLEFSVKDLRSRLKEPDAAQSVLPQSVKQQESDSMLPVRTQQELELKNVDCIHLSEECETNLQVSFRLFIKSFVFSLHTNDRQRDSLKTEVCNMYADDMMFAYDDDDERRELHLQLPNLQVDNQLYSNGKYDFPVLLCAQKLYKRDSCLPQVYDLDELYRSQAQGAGSISELTFVFYQDELQLQAVCCKLQPLRVYIEDAYLNQLLDTLVECAPSNCIHTPHPECKRLQLEAGQTWLPEQVVGQALCIAEPLRLHSFIVEPLSLLLSVHTSSRLYIALDHSPLSFSRYERQQILTVPLRFGQSLGLHYLSGAIFGAGWVVGSLEILGSPSGLARSFTTGLRDFISMPVQGLFRGPWGFLVGITQGSASLLRNVTAGTVNSVTKLAGSVARNLDRLTLDSEHIELTEARRRARPQGFADGLTQGLTGLGISLLGAVGGLAHHTLEARSSVGVLTGLTKGIVGALTKPISGAAEMLALTGQGVLHTVGFNAMPLQVEPSVTRNVALHNSSYRIWRFLHEKLSSDQLLFFHEITLLLDGQLHPALLYLTSTVLVIMELKCDDLKFISSVLKLEVLADREDSSKLYLSLKPEQSDDMEGMKFTNERIISFLNASRVHGPMCNDSLSDLLQLHDQDQARDDHLRRQTQCIFYIKPNIGQHLIHYLKVLGQTQ